MPRTLTAPEPAASPPQVGSAGSQPAQALWRRWQIAVAGGLPNLIVFSLLGGVMYFGHHTGWRMPNISELIGAPAAVADDWCLEHLVPESQCIECRPDLHPKADEFGFCREHGVAECVIHHPELAQVRGAPRLPQYDTAATISLLPRATNNSRDTLHTRRVQFASADAMARAGVEVDVVQERPMIDAVTANGELTFDPTRVAHLASRVPGTVAFVFKTIGDEVQEGEILALVDSAQVGQAKAQLLQAIVQVQLRRTTVERTSQVAASGAVAGKALIEAESALEEAEVALISAQQALANLGFELPEQLETVAPKQLAEDLRFLGVPSYLLASLPTHAQTANLIPLRAPFAGVVVASQIVAGEVVGTSNTLFTVADPRQLWLLLAVRQEDAKYVTRGLPVQFQADDRSAEVTGHVSWLSPAVNGQTRTLRVRVRVGSTGGTLRDRTFGTGRIILREEPNAITVPREAVQSTGDVHLVFVRDKNYFEQTAPKFFHVRQVRVGARDEQHAELLAGVLPGEVVSTKGSPVLMGQLLRSAFGSGCGCHE